MKRNVLLTGLLFLLNLSICAQNHVPIIRATSEVARTQEGKNAESKKWYISPELKPDIYTAHSRHATVYFYTDLDTISFKVEPGKTFNFIILLNGKDSAFTQVKYEKPVAVQTHLEILKTGRKYDFTDTKPINNFTYGSAQSPEHVKLREVFHLDSIAGKGDELSKILNLLHWVHDSYSYDGTKELPPHDGIVDLMTKCSTGRFTMHCGALAQVLNECYLSIGIKSRRVVCLPKDSTDFDCHSINAVYSNTFKKWLWVDPTNNAYVMNENGELLSIAEVRERLITNKPLLLNPDANINRSFSVVKQNYLYDYMAKNLYAFQCFVDRGGESQCNVLLPIEYKGVIPRTRMYKPMCTNNPDIFWATPE
jgi:hypothetical protein